MKSLFLSLFFLCLLKSSSIQDYSNQKSSNFRANMIAGDEKPVGNKGTVKDIDGNVYKTIKIGNQWWMAENLKVTRYQDGTDISHVAGNSSWKSTAVGTRCVYNNDSSNAVTYSRLYNWYAVNDSRNIAPEGWHVPTDDEWKTLERYLGMSRSVADDTGWRGINEGGKLKETGNDHWNSPNPGATDEFGFRALPGGYRGSDDGKYYYLGDYGLIWTASEEDRHNAWYRQLTFGTSDVIRNNVSKRNGFSVRCVRDK